MKKVRPQEAENLEAAIADSGIRPAELARILGVSPGMIYQWKSGLRPVPVKSAPKLADALGVDPASICAGFAAMVMNDPGNVVPIRRQPKQEQPRDLVEDELRALRYAVGALAAAMAVHRPAEAADVARVIRKRVPASYQEKGLIAELLAMFDKGAG